MKLNFTYDKEKDIWCLLTYGKKSVNSGLTTKAYDELIEKYGGNPSQEEASIFIDEYISTKNISTEKLIVGYEKDWNLIKDTYQKRAEEIFGVFLHEDVTVYLTINNRCPYDLANNGFFISMSRPASTGKLTAMHELWHFYTWYAFGVTEEEKIGKQRYNDIKEALTVLLNIECKDLLPEGVQDNGYPQHGELREKITQLWLEHKDLKKVINILLNL